jgi:hypothetical protein
MILDQAVNSALRKNGNNLTDEREVVNMDLKTYGYGRWIA